MEGKIEKKFEEHDEKTKKNTGIFQQFIEMMQRDKQERAEKEAKDREEKEQERQERAEKEAKDREEKERRRMQKEEEKQNDKQQKEKRRKEKEEEKLLEKRDMMQRFESLEKRIIEREENVCKKIESMVRKNTKEMKEELEDKKEEDDQLEKNVQNEIQKTNESQKQEQQLEDDQLKEKVQDEIKEANESEEQEEQLKEFHQRPEANKTNQIIENVYTGKIDATMQLQIIYGDMRFSSCKQTNNIQRHLQEIQRINKEDNEDEIIVNIQNILERKAEIWARIGIKCEKALSNQFWGMLECEERYPLLEGKTNENCEIQEQQKAEIQGNNQLKQIDSNITNDELYKRNKRWKWSQQSHNASVKRKGRSLLKSSIRTP